MKTIQKLRSYTRRYFLIPRGDLNPVHPEAHVALMRHATELMFRPFDYLSAHTPEALLAKFQEMTEAMAALKDGPAYVAQGWRASVARCFVFFSVLGDSTRTECRGGGQFPCLQQQSLIDRPSY